MITKNNSCTILPIMVQYQIVIRYFPCSLLLGQSVQKHIVSGESHGDVVMKGARDQKEVQATMNKYELALVVNAKIEEDVRVATVEKAKEYVAKFGGTVTEVEEWGKKKLAYEIQHMKEGYYYFIKFDAEANVPGSLEQAVRIMDNVIRFLCIRQEA